MERVAIRQKSAAVILAALVAIVLGAGALFATPQTAHAVTPPSKTAVTLAKVTPKKIKVTCKAVNKATGYQVKVSTKSTFPSTSATKTYTGTARIKYPSTLKAGTKYYVKARAYKLYKGKKYYGPWSTIKNITTYKASGTYNGWRFSIKTTDCECEAPKIYGAILDYIGTSKTPTAPAKVNGVDVVWVSCEGKNLTSLNVYNCTKLKRLDCRYNKLTKLSVANCPNLFMLECYSNNIATLDLSKNTALRCLQCSENNIRALDLTKLTKLEELDADENPLNSIKLNCKSTLARLTLDNTDIVGSMDFAGYTALQNLGLYATSVTQVNVKGLSKLRQLGLAETDVTSIDLTGCTGLVELVLSGTKITTLDVTMCKNLTDLYLDQCSKLRMMNLDVSKCTKLETLYISGTLIGTVDVSNCPNLWDFDYDPEETDVIGWNN